MRRIGEDPETLRLLEQGAKAAEGKTELSKRLEAAEANIQKLNSHIQEQVTMLRYALGNVFKTLNSYPAVKEQVEQIDYRTLALVRVLKKLNPGVNLDDEIELEARALRIEIFDEMSAKDDENRKLVVSDGEEITENHLVIISSKCEDDNLAIFRSKMDVGGPELAEIKDSFLGKKAGDTVDVTIQGKEHSVLIHSTRKKPDAAATT